MNNAEEAALTHERARQFGGSIVLDRSVRLETPQLKWLAQEAARRDVSLSAVVRAAMMRRCGGRTRGIESIPQCISRRSRSANQRSGRND